LSVLVELIALASIIDSIRRYRFFGNFGFRPIGATQVLIGVGVLLVVGAVLALARVYMQRRLPTAAWMGACAALVALVLGLGWLHQRDFNKARYRHYDATLDWLISHAPTGHRVGLAGGASGGYDSPPLVMFGPRFGNFVSFVGPKYRGLLEEYHQAQPFIAALRRGRFDLL